MLPLRPILSDLARNGATAGSLAIPSFIRRCHDGATLCVSSRPLSRARRPPRPLSRLSTPLLRHEGPAMEVPAVIAGLGLRPEAETYALRLPCIPREGVSQREVTAGEEEEVIGGEAPPRPDRPSAPGREGVRATPRHVIRQAPRLEAEVGLRLARPHIVETGVPSLDEVVGGSIPILCPAVAGFLAPTSPLVGLPGGPTPLCPRRPTLGSRVR